MFFRKKKETDVDVLQKIKDRISEEDTQNNETITEDGAIDDNGVFVSVDDDSETNNDPQDEVIDEINKVVEQSVVANDDEKDNFENSLEGDFLADVFAETEEDDVDNNEETEEDQSGSSGDSSDDLSENSDNKMLGLDGKWYTEDDLTYMSVEELAKLGFLERSKNNATDIDQDDNDLQSDEDYEENTDDDEDKGVLSVQEDKEDEGADINVIGTGDEASYLDDVFSDDNNNNNTKQREGHEQENNADDENGLDIDDKSGEDADTFDEETESSGVLSDSDIEDIADDVDGKNDNDVDQVDNEDADDSDNADILDDSIDDVTETSSETNGNAGVGFPVVPSVDAQISNSDNIIVSVKSKNRERQVEVSDATKNNVKGSITDLIENVKNQILSKRQSTHLDSRNLGSKTVEQLVSDIIRPLVVEYLDANLNRLVKESVDKEIKKIVSEVDVDDE